MDSKNLRILSSAVDLIYPFLQQACKSETDRRL